MGACFLKAGNGVRLKTRRPAAAAIDVVTFTANYGEIATLIAAERTIISINKSGSWTSE